MAVRYHLRLPDPAAARGSDARFAFRASGAEGLAQELQDALQHATLFERWRDAQDEPDDVDASLGAVDAAARVSGEQRDLAVLLVATTSLPGAVFKHRLRLLAGSHWELRDVTAG